MQNGTLLIILEFQESGTKDKLLGMTLQVSKSSKAHKTRYSDTMYQEWLY